MSAAQVSARVSALVSALVSGLVSGLVWVRALGLVFQVAGRQRLVLALMLVQASELVSGLVLGLMWTRVWAQGWRLRHSLSYCMHLPTPGCPGRSWWCASAQARPPGSPWRHTPQSLH